MYYVFLQASFKINADGEKVFHTKAPETVIKRNIKTEEEAQEKVREIDAAGYSDADKRINRFARYDHQKASDRKRKR